MSWNWNIGTLAQLYEGGGTTCPQFKYAFSEYQRIGKFTEEKAMEDLGWELAKRIQATDLDMEKMWESFLSGKTLNECVKDGARTCGYSKSSILFLHGLAKAVSLVFFHRFGYLDTVFTEISS